jgi:hypothetical protein
MARAVIPDRDVWAAAVLIVKRYGDDAMLEAAERADQLLDEGDMAGAETWRRNPSWKQRLQCSLPYRKWTVANYREPSPML